MINFYFGMDGVLAKYDSKLYKKDPITRKTPVDTKDKHCFRSLQADNRMINVIFHFINQNHSPNCKDLIKIHVISALTKEGSIFMEQYYDKVTWLEHNVPNLSIDNFHPIVGGRQNIKTFINNQKLCSADILIDSDYDNLHIWQAAGGTAIKYVNNSNYDEGWDGLRISQDMSSSDIADMLTIIAKTNHSFYK